MSDCPQDTDRLFTNLSVAVEAKESAEHEYRRAFETVEAIRDKLWGENRPWKKVWSDPH